MVDRFGNPIDRSEPADLDARKRDGLVGDDVEGGDVRIATVLEERLADLVAGHPERAQRQEDPASVNDRFSSTDWTKRSSNFTKLQTIRRSFFKTTFDVTDHCSSITKLTKRSCHKWTAQSRCRESHAGLCLRKTASTCRVWPFCVE